MFENFKILLAKSKYLFLFSFSLIWEFFTQALVDGFSLEFKWQQVSSSLQEFSPYPSRSWKSCSLEGLYLTYYFQVFQAP